MTTSRQQNALLQAIKHYANELILGIYPRPRAPESQPSALVSELAGCIVVSTEGVYDCRPCASPSALFLSLVKQDKAGTDQLGISLKLDLADLYTQAADWCIERVSW